MSLTGGGGLARVPNLRVCKHLWQRGGTRRGGRMKKHPAVVPSNRRGKTSSETQRRKSRAAKKRLVAATSYGDDRQSSPILEVRPGNTAGLVKTVNIQVKWAAAHPGQDRRHPGVVTHSRLQRATSVRSRVGIVLEDGSGVAIDWVTGRSYSSARRRLDAQSGQRKGRKGAAAPYPSVAVRDRGRGH